MALRTKYRRRRLEAASGGLAAREGGAMNLKLSSSLGMLIGERNVPGEVDALAMSAHAGRYVWAMARCEGQRLVDLGCGVGYGSFLLSWTAGEVTGIDIDVGAITYARENFKDVRYLVGDLSDPHFLPQADIAVCFEVLEHLPAPEPLLEAVFQRYPRALFSFPNPLLQGSHVNPHHVQDWPLRTLKRKIREAGGGRMSVWHQALRSAAVIRGGRPWAGTWLVDVRSRRERLRSSP